MRNLLKIFCFSFVLATVFAMAPGEAEAQQSATIIVSPPSFELYANPGESITETVRITNQSDVASNYQIVVEDFVAVGEEGQVDLVEDDQSNMTYSLAKWVMPEPETFTLQGQEEKQITFTINVPKDAEPGGHYSSILVRKAGQQTDGTGAAVTSRVGSLVLLRVSGNVKEEASVESFSAKKSYYEKGPVDFELRVKNAGNNHVRPSGVIIVTDIFGRKVTEVQLDGLNVLPDAIRKMDTEWSFTALLANRYTATLVATYGQQNNPLSATTNFWIFPKWLAAIVILGLVLIVAVVLGRKKIKGFVHKLTK